MSKSKFSILFLRKEISVSYLLIINCLYFSFLKIQREKWANLIFNIKKMLPYFNGIKLNQTLNDKFVFANIKEFKSSTYI